MERDDRADATLLQHWIDRRDESSFQEIHRRHAGLVRSVASRLGSPDPDEVTQSAFLLLANRPETVKDGTRLTGWLIGVARRLTANQRRHGRRELRLDATMEATLGSHDLHPGDEWDHLRGPLDEELGKLSSGRRKAVTLVYLEGKSQTEAAALLGCTIQALRVRLSEGLSHLREKLRRGYSGLAVFFALVPFLRDRESHGRPPLATRKTAKGPAGSGNGSTHGPAMKTGWWMATATAAGLGFLTLAAFTHPQKLPSSFHVPPSEFGSLAALADKSLRPAEPPAEHSSEHSGELRSEHPPTPSALASPTNHPAVQNLASLQASPGPTIHTQEKVSVAPDRPADRPPMPPRRGRWVWKPGVFRTLQDGGHTQWWWEWDRAGAPGK